MADSGINFVSLPAGVDLRSPDQYVASVGQDNIASTSTLNDPITDAIGVSTTPHTSTILLGDCALALNNDYLHRISLVFVQHCNTQAVALTIHFPNAGNGGVRVAIAPISTLSKMREALAQLHALLPCGMLDLTDSNSDADNA